MVYSPPWLFPVREAEPQKLPLPWPGHGAFRLVYLKFESLRYEARYALHHPLSRTLAGNVDILVVCITHEPVTAAL